MVFPERFLADALVDQDIDLDAITRDYGAI